MLSPSDSALGETVAAIQGKERTSESIKDERAVMSEVRLLPRSSMVHAHSQMTCRRRASERRIPRASVVCSGGLPTLGPSGSTRTTRRARATIRLEPLHLLRLLRLLVMRDLSGDGARVARVSMNGSPSGSVFSEAPSQEHLESTGSLRQSCRSTFSPPHSPLFTY